MLHQMFEFIVCGRQRITNKYPRLRLSQKPFRCQPGPFEHWEIERFPVTEGRKSGSKALSSTRGAHTRPIGVLIALSNVSFNDFPIGLFEQLPRYSERRVRTQPKYSSANVAIEPICRTVRLNHLN